MANPSRLRLARDEAGLTLEKVSELLERQGHRLSPGQLSRIERSGSGTRTTRIEQLAEIYHKRPADLLDGSDEDLPERVARRATVVTVPLIDFVQAGSWTEIADPYAKGQGSRRVPVMGRVGPQSFALTLRGDSMLDQFADGDIIVVDPSVRPTPGKFVVAKLDDEEVATFKQYRERGLDRKKRPIIELAPLNTVWPTLVMDANRPGRIVGVAIEHIRFL